MVRTTIELTPALKKRLAEEARLRGVSVHEIVREMLDRALPQRHKKMPRSKDPFFANKKTYKGTPPDLSSRVDDYLYGCE